MNGAIRDRDIRGQRRNLIRAARSFFDMNPLIYSLSKLSGCR